MIGNPERDTANICRDTPHFYDTMARSFKHRFANA